MLTACVYLSKALFSSNSIAMNQQPFYKEGEASQLPFRNSPDDYKSGKQVLQTKRNQLLSSPTRFQRISQRYDRSDFPEAGNKCIGAGRYFPRYRGFDIWKCPVDLVLYHQLLEMVKPKTVIELGTLSGGMTIWIADTMKLLQVDCNIFSMDIDLSNLNEIVKKVKPQNVNFLQGDSFAIENTFTSEFLAKLEHPWVFIEDAHANLNGVLCHFHQYLVEGDYIVVEDTNPEMPSEIGMGAIGNNYYTMGRGPLDCLRHFLKEYEDYYAVDSFLNDMFGYNGTWHWHGFIRKMK